jgi:hypothetical protein
MYRSGWTTRWLSGFGCGRGRQGRAYRTDCGGTQKKDLAVKSIR